VKLLDTRRGTTSLELLVGTRRAAGRFVLGARGGRANTLLGTVVLTRRADGTINATIGALIGVLRPGPTITGAEFHHVALSSIGNLKMEQPREIAPSPSPRLVGGGYMFVRVRANGTSILKGRLPDGCPFTASGFVTDIKTIALYSVENTGTTVRGYFGGDLVRANLELTDMTGELTWSKPPQPVSAKYPYRDGVNTVLQANGCISTNAPLNGQAVLQLQGGNLTIDESSNVNVLNNQPPNAGSLTGWSPKPGGTFLVRISVPYSPNPAIGSGILLPKSKRAWGYFGGLTDGGLIDLRLTTQPE
jgi:hypothetical protein